MSIMPVDKSIYEMITETMNSNSHGVIFSGNYMFRFWQQNSSVHNFEIIKREDDELDIKTQRVVPMVELQSIEMPYVEDNERRDYEKEFYFAFKIEATKNAADQRIIEFDYEDIYYQSLLEGIEKLRTKEVKTIAGRKFVFKVKQPQKVNVFKYNGEHYQLLSVNMNLVSLGTGEFANNIEVYLREKTDASTVFEKLDIRDGNITVVKNLIRYRQPKISIEQKTMVEQRTYAPQLTINFHGDKEVERALLEEANALGSSDREYEMRVYMFAGTTYEQDYNLDVRFAQASQGLKRNTVFSITLHIERV